MQKAIITVQAQFDGVHGFSSTVRMSGSKVCCASFFSTSAAGAARAAELYCTLYKLSMIYAD